VSHRSRELDAVRAVAALMVLAGHAYLVGGVATPHTSTSLTDVLIVNGGAGIWLFFALSGYLIGAPFLRALRTGEPLPSPLGYATRRAARILPAYWVALAALLVLAPVAGLAWWQVPLHGALLHNLVPGEGQAVFFVAWTLGIEALFYAFVPLAAAVVRRARGPRPIAARQLVAGIGALWLASVAYAVWAARAYPNTSAFTATENADLFRLSLPALLSAFCPGLLVAVADRERWLDAVKPRTAALLGSAALFAVAGAIAYTSTSTVVIDLSRQPWALAAGLVLLAALGARPTRAVTALAPIGLISYGLYLWHYVVVKVLDRAGVTVQAGALSWPLRIALVLALSIPLAAASWLLIERPLLRRTRGWWARRRTGTAAEPAPAPAG
jgi:peptidoglycan/LPS O-acetylase OafA/YrhL